MQNTNILFRVKQRLFACMQEDSILYDNKTQYNFIIFKNNLHVCMIAEGVITQYYMYSLINKVHLHARKKIL